MSAKSIGWTGYLLILGIILGIGYPILVALEDDSKTDGYKQLEKAINSDKSSLKTLDNIMEHSQLLGTWLETKRAWKCTYSENGSYSAVVTLRQSIAANEIKGVVTFIMHGHLSGQWAYSDKIVTVTYTNAELKVDEVIVDAPEYEKEHGSKELEIYRGKIKTENVASIANGFFLKTKDVSTLISVNEKELVLKNNDDAVTKSLRVSD